MITASEARYIMEHSNELIDEDDDLFRKIDKRIKSACRSGLDNISVKLNKIPSETYKSCIINRLKNNGFKVTYYNPFRVDKLQIHPSIKIKW